MDFHTELEINEPILVWEGKYQESSPKYRIVITYNQQNQPNVNFEKVVNKDCLGNDNWELVKKEEIPMEVIKHLAQVIVNDKDVYHFITDQKDTKNKKY